MSKKTSADVSKVYALRCGIYTATPYSEEYTDAYLTAINSVVAERKYLSTDKPFSRKEIYDYLRGFAESGEPSLILTDGNGKCIGWCDVVGRDRRLGIGVIKEERGKGCGAFLLSAITDVARAKGYKKLTLRVRTDNPAVSLYEKHGFVKRKKLGYFYFEGVKTPYFGMKKLL